MPRITAVFVLTFSFAVAESAIGDRFALWNRCDNMFLEVGGKAESQHYVEWIETTLTTAVRSRLRAVRLYDENWWQAPNANYDGRGTLDVDAVVLDDIYVVHVKYIKWVTDLVTEAGGQAPTWSEWTVGAHGGDTGHILSSGSWLIDRFIDEYLRANADAC